LIRTGPLAAGARGPLPAWRLRKSGEERPPWQFASRPDSRPGAGFPYCVDPPLWRHFADALGIGGAASAPCLYLRDSLRCLGCCPVGGFETHPGTSSKANVPRLGCGKRRLWQVGDDEPRPTSARAFTNHTSWADATKKSTCCHGCSKIQRPGYSHHQAACLVVITPRVSVLSNRRDPGAPNLFCGYSCSQ